MSLSILSKITDEQKEKLTARIGAWSIRAKKGGLVDDTYEQWSKDRRRFATLSTLDYAREMMDWEWYQEHEYGTAQDRSIRQQLLGIIRRVASEPRLTGWDENFDGGVWGIIF